MSESKWIVIPNWDRFQHYKDRAPSWIKIYPELHHDEAFMSLTGHRRAILLGIWLEYAMSRRQLPDDTATLSRRLGLRVLRADIESLNHAGFIEVSASKPLALARSREKRREERTLEGSLSSPRSEETPDAEPAHGLGMAAGSANRHTQWLHNAGRHEPTIESLTEELQRRGATETELPNLIQLWEQLQTPNGNHNEEQALTEGTEAA